MASVDSLKDAANALYKDGKYEPAIAAYTSAITAHPANAALYANRAAAYVMLEKYVHRARIHACARVRVFGHA